MTLSDDPLAIVELRQYTHYPAQRDVLIDMFERLFVAPREALGSTVIAQFRDLDDPNRLVWLRGFAGLEARARALTGFYTSPIWLTERDAANATILDSDNVLLLRPAGPGAGVTIVPRATSVNRASLVEITVWSLREPAEHRFVPFFDQHLAPALAAAGAHLAGCYLTDPGPNSYPRLPVREGEQVFVWLASFATVDSHARYRQRLCGPGAWRDLLDPMLSGWLTGPTQTMRLAPTAGSNGLA